jgi:hypothetical protein
MLGISIQTPDLPHVANQPSGALLGFVGFELKSLSKGLPT